MFLLFENKKKKDFIKRKTLYIIILPPFCSSFNCFRFCLQLCTVMFLSLTLFQHEAGKAKYIHLHYCMFSQLLTSLAVLSYFYKIDEQMNTFIACDTHRLFKILCYGCVLFFCVASKEKSRSIDESDGLKYLRINQIYRIRIS